MPLAHQRKDSSADLDLGDSLNPCELGDDCPYKGAIKYLHDERLKREQSEGQFATTLDKLADKVHGVTLSIEAFERKLLDVRALIDAHTKAHRWFELIIIGVAMGVGSAIQRWLGGK